MHAWANVMFVVGMAAAAAFDWRHRRIPNWLNLTICVVGLGVRRHSFCDPPLHLRMHDRLQSGPGLVIGEDDPRERGPVERAVGGDRRIAEAIPDGVEALGAGSDRVAREPVGVDDDGPPLREHAGHRGLPGADPTGETDQQHGSVPTRSGPRGA